MFFFLLLCKAVQEQLYFSISSMKLADSGGLTITETLKKYVLVITNAVNLGQLWH